MGAFLYFLPEAMAKEKFLAERAPIFGPNCPVATRSVNAGPEGQPGTLIAPNPGPGRDGKAFLPTKQVWHRAPGASWFFGWLKDDPPSPEGLARESTLPGHLVCLGDGNPWQIPVARFATGEIVLPKALGLDAAGNFALRPLPEFSYLADGAEKFWQAWSGAAKGEMVTIDFEKYWPIAVEALRLNYRVGAQEVSVLGLVTTPNLWDVLKALIDWPTVEKFLEEQEAQKKTSDDPGAGSSTGSGVTDSPGTTPPVSPTLNSTSEEFETPNGE